MRKEKNKHRTSRKHNFNKATKMKYTSRKEHANSPAQIKC